MKSLMLLWQNVLEETGTWCRICTTRDLKTASRRFDAEGLSFLSITLARFGKDFEKSLDQGYVADDLFAGFKRMGGLPRFLGGFLRLVFEPDGRALLPSPSIDAIQAIRQLTLMNSKIQIPCSETRNKKAVDGYVQLELELKERDRVNSRRASADEALARLGRVFALLFGSVLSELDRRVQVGPQQWSQRDMVDRDPEGCGQLCSQHGSERHYLVPRHGPGATADCRFGNEKFLTTGWTRRLESVFPSSDYLVPNYRYADSHLNSGSGCALVEPGAEIPVKVTLVPKTLKTPRIIAEEPTAMMYMQQAIWRDIRDLWEQDSILSSLVTFRDQTPNRELAQLGSLKGELATLDLSEASDRVSNSLVRSLFSRWPSLADGIDATRSRQADVPGHGVIRLAKYASMGSALCFPIETMVFLSIICLSWEERLARPIRRSDLRRLAGYVRVFGDDMIVPVDLVPSVIGNLEAFGFKVNTDKSFWTGKFRESCGGDYYDGHEINVIRVRQMIPTRRQDATEVVALVSLRNQFYWAGFWGTAAWLDDLLQKILGFYPVVEPTSAALGRESVLPYRAERTNSMHQPLVRAYCVKSVIPSNPLDGVPALLKFLTMRGSEPLDEGHLERSGRPRTVDIKARWTLPY